MNYRREKKKLYKCFVKQFGLSKNDALKYAAILAWSEYDQIYEAVSEILASHGQKNVLFAGNNSSFMIQHLFDISYPASLALAEEITFGLESSLLSDDYVNIEKKNGDRIILSAKYIDRYGRDLTETKKREFDSNAISIEELLKKLNL